MSGQRKNIPSPAELTALPKDGGPDWNRLVFEKSPYLLQHAGNPVDWYPWGDEAFEAARSQDKPVFLSIGYATCHWCHVMERESFEDEEIASLLNDAFVCVKVDREERPDVDHVYMSVTQALTGHGGWPMTVVMTADRRPFFAGTYFPRDARHGRPGMKQLVPMLKDAWTRQRAALVDEADRIGQALAEMTSAARGGTLDDRTLASARAQLASRFDAVHGGFGHAPKFPTAHQLSFLLAHHRRTGDADSLRMVETTLDAMRRGGVFDHVGFGIHRYSTDRRWLVPHFEKMLYDQALLLMACVEAHQVTGTAAHAAVAREIAAYVLRDMTSPEGGFWSAEDADSEGEEGLFYTWTLDELREVLGVEEGDLFAKAHGVEPGGNWRDEATGTVPGTNILHLPRTPDDEARARLEASRARLFDVRERRVHPLKDDKILADWNGLMIAALAQGGGVLGERAWIDAASRAADFVLTRMRDADGRLLKRYRGGDAGLPAILDDYAFMTLGLLELYRATFDEARLQQALDLARTMLRDFSDPDAGGLFMTSVVGERLPVRAKEAYDGAQPSGNSVAALALLRLARLTGDSTFEDQGARILDAFSHSVERAPSAHCVMLRALDLLVGPSQEIVIAGRRGADDVEEMARALRRAYLPNSVLLFRDDADPSELARLAPFTEGMSSDDGRARAYACTDFACHAPTTDVRTFLADA